MKKKARYIMDNPYDIERSKRVVFLKDQLLQKEREVCFERALLITKAYQEFCYEPLIIKRALALEKILTNMSIYILPKELIVGHQASKQRSAPLFPEMGIQWLKNEIHTLQHREQDSFQVSSQVKEKLKTIIPYWEDKGLRETLYAARPEETKKQRLESKVFSVTAHEETGLGHVLLDYQSIIDYGLETSIKQIMERLEDLDLTKPEGLSKYDFYKASLIACRASMNYARRYSKKAEEMASLENDEERREELLEIKKICERVPEKPARNFWEALQSLWFVHLIPQIENNGSSYSPGRIDQYLYPYYQKDLKMGVIPREKVQELIDCLWIKFSEPLILYNQQAASIAGGFPMGQNVTIGGVNVQGDDSTNELSFLFLNAQEHIGLAQPNLTVRVHKKSPIQFLLRGAQVVTKGTGMPQFLNDEQCISALLHNKVPLKRAREYAPVGCVENSVVGAWGRENGGYFNLAKILEYTLNNGICRITKKKRGLPLGYLSDYHSFEELMIAYKKQLDFFLPHLIIENNLIDKIHGENVPSPLVSILVPGCIENGEEVTKGGALFNFTGPTAVGAVNTGNSLAAIKKLIFKEKKITPKELEEALEANYQGYEEILYRVINDAPKFGNDFYAVDGLIKDLLDYYADQVEKYRNTRGGCFRPGLTAVTAHVGMGKDVGATPDGRLAQEALNDGISPYPGTDVKGPTAVAVSVSQIDFVRFGKGMILNQTFSPFLLASSKGLRSLVDFIYGYFDLGGMHIQFNVISRETLKKAQKYPQQYKSLVVRVAGYSAIFVDLNHDVQNQIIARTEHGSLDIE